MERRANQIPIQQNEDRSITGLAAVFYNPADQGTQFQLGPKTVERILPSAFDKALLEDDVIALFNHDPSLILGRKSSGRLSLERTAKGLAYTIKPSKSQIYKEVRQHIADGDIVGSSFAFIPTDQEWTKEGELRVRNIKAVKLVDVSVVTMAAYQATSVGLRSEDFYKKIIAEEIDRLKRRLRIIQLEENDQ